MTRQSRVTYTIWALLVLSGVFGAYELRWSIVFVSLATLALTLLPLVLQSWSGIRIPAGFVAGVNLFIVGTLFLGEVGAFYYRFWWWDILMHSGSAVGFAMIGTVFVVMLNRSPSETHTSPILGAVMAYCFAVAMGAMWEIFEFAMDELFGFNMQKSGLVDTMGDLIVDCIGAGVGAVAGFFYLRGQHDGWLTGVLAQFVRDNLRRRRP
ncbi:hypothetical protein [Salipiger mucosus]|nr:hypothetical protein [Salipiger mucosus]